MIILDKKIAGGSLLYKDVGSSSYDSGNGDATSYPSAYIRTNSSSGQTPSKLKFNSSDSLLTWNRMQDGVLVEAEIFSKFVASWQYSGLYPFPYKSGSVASENAISQNANAYMSKGGQTEIGVYGFLYEYYIPNCSIDGATYNLSCIRIGATNAEFNSFEYKKYIIDSKYQEGDWGKYTNSPTYDWYELSTNSVYIQSLSNLEYFGMIKNAQFSLYTRPALQEAKRQIIRLIAFPSGNAPKISPNEVSLGATQVSPTYSFNLDQTCDIDIYIDNTLKKSEQSKSGTYKLDISEYFQDLSMGNHTVRLITKKDGYKCGAELTFKKTQFTVSVMGNPISTDSMATFCTMADSVTVPSGATITREVCNNANDSSPAWEEYTGDEHAFVNDKKTNKSWGVNWKITIDNSEGASQARISTGVAMGILQKGSD